MKPIFLFIALFFVLHVNGQILSYTNYRTSAQVDAAINTLHSTYPTLTSIVNLGNSIEGRPIKALRISSSSANDPGKGDVVFTALIHAREWISGETVLYLADKMLQQRATDAVLRANMDRLQIWIIPVLNPDGFLYTQTTDRYWRKNRRNNGDGTFGVDLNRNWGYQWGLSSGSSASTSSDIYHGTGPFSEAETIRMRDFLSSLTNLKSLVSYHSYSEFYLRPWSYTTSDPPGEQTLHSIVLRNISRIQAVHGHVYTETIGYTSSGETTDYLWNEYRAASFTPELRPSAATTGGVAGFSPAATEILPCAQENYPAALALINDAALPRVYIRDNNSDAGAEPSAGYHWESPDIWTVPATLNQNAVVTLHVRVQNNTGATINNVNVEAFFTDPRITLEFPSLTATSIGNTTVNVPNGGRDVTFSWRTPTGTNSWGELHWCVGAVVKQDSDMPLTTVVARSSNIACHNFNTTTIVESGIINVAATNFLSVAAELQINFNQNELPADWRFELPEISEIQASLQSTPGTIRKSKLLKTKGILLEPGQTIKIPIKVHYTQVPASDVLVRIKGDLLPIVSGKRTAVGNGYTYQVKAK
ncbi:MAG: zinc carboxypeptidase [Bacteroidetes bacterium]|nr:zinc carboxypeptidase [Bacteroidota bacterium]